MYSDELIDIEETNDQGTEVFKIKRVAAVCYGLIRDEVPSGRRFH
jgi:hypothetical protein